MSTTVKASFKDNIKLTVNWYSKDFQLISVLGCMCCMSAWWVAYLGPSRCITSTDIVESIIIDRYYTEKCTLNSKNDCLFQCKKCTL